VEEALMARLLVLTSRLPYPPREGHQLRSWHLLRALAAAHEITLLSCERDDDEPQACAPLRALVERLETFPVRAQRSRAALLLAAARGVAGPRPFVVEKYAGSALRRRVAELAPQADLIHVDMLPLVALLDGVATAAPVVLNAHNVEHELLQQRAAIETNRARRLFLHSQTRKLARFERAACRRADLIVACSADDARALARLAPQTPIAIVPNGVDIERHRPAAAAPPAPPQLVFVGQMGWFPNHDGVQWFMAEILPRVLAARRDAQFVVVGKSDGLKVPAALREHVRLAGFVDDVGAAVDAASVYVVPLRTGSGTRLKVLEAMAHGKPIVTTTIGAQGIDLVPGAEALFADDADAFAAAVVRVLGDAGLAAQLGAAACAKAQTRYDWAAIGRDLVSSYAGLLHARDATMQAPRLASAALSN
jgi:glycosyltransferase involved in cell wall biosynthesis